jgi:hypothetical protein
MRETGGLFVSTWFANVLLPLEIARFSRARRSCGLCLPQAIERVLSQAVAKERMSLNSLAAILIHYQ